MGRRRYDTFGGERGTLETGSSISDDGTSEGSVRRPRTDEAPPPLGLWSLAVLVFYNVSGGPFGIESAVRAGGNLLAVLGFAAGPLVWSVPEALVTAELGSALPGASGGVAWVEEAFGDAAATLAGTLGWVSGATDNAVYPALFLDYASGVLGAGGGLVGWTRFLTLSAVTVALALLNYAGLEIVGRSSILLCLLSMSPFVVLTIMGLPRVVPSRWLRTPVGPAENGEPSLLDDDFQTSSGPLPPPTLGGVLWRPYLNNLFWNLNSFDSAASFAGETADFERTYPRGVFVGLVMTIASYLVPLMVAVGATDYPQEEWVDGFLGRVAVDVGGGWLGAWVVFAAGVSNLGLFEAELSADSFQLMGMAERGYLPRVFGRRSPRHGTPSVGILFSACVIVVLCTADFESLLQLLNSVYSISLLLEYAAFVKLRLCRKDLPRPYRIPIPDWAAPLLVLPPVTGILVILAISNWYVYMFSIGSVAIGVGLFKLMEVCKRREWLEFEVVDRHLDYDMAQMSEDSTTESPASPRDTRGGNGMAHRVSPREGGYDDDNDVKGMT